MNASDFRICLFVTLIAGIGVNGTISGANGQEDHKPAPKPKQEDNQTVSGKTQKVPISDIQKFCLNNIGILKDARLRWQTAKLSELEKRLRKQIEELDAKRVEYSQWLARRDEVMKAIQENVVAIYAQMRPETAAQQLAAMEDNMAAIILGKLTSRKASAILNEMEAGRAAKLTNTIVGPLPATIGGKS
ncbi:MotE family protein [Beijerinckia mobilis]|uniref:MotE family protein n=1 Tax=Beijerinckia mobilis TaxID=231434 RepID=UPI0006923459|nr:MotE family protein [Beijerinckia mobilis]